MDNRNGGTPENATVTENDQAVMESIINRIRSSAKLAEAGKESQE